LLFTWGTGEYGELGQGFIKKSMTPNMVNHTISDFITKLGCGYSYTVFIDCIVI
jgi:alpha-tubulin suppressor-like RCC1 family protein